MTAIFGSRLKQFKLLTGVLPNSLWDVAEQSFVAANLCNFQPGLAALLVFFFYLISFLFCKEDDIHFCLERLTC